MASRPFATCTIGVDNAEKTTNVIKPTAVSKTDIRTSSRRKVCFIFSHRVSKHLEILEISWNFTGKFYCQLKCDSMPITEPDLVTSLNPRNCHLTNFCAVLFIMSYIT